MMASSGIRASLRRAWRTVSLAGVNTLSPVRSRSVMATNQTATMALAMSVPVAIFLFGYPGGAFLAPAIGHALMIAVLASVIYLNSRGWSTVAALVTILAGLVQHLYLAWYFSSEAGFQLVLVLGGALSFTLIPARRRAVSIATLVATTAGFVVAQTAFDAPGTANVAAAEHVAPGLVYVNAVLVMGGLYIVLQFSHAVFMQERARNEELLKVAQSAAQTDALTEVHNRRGIAPVLSHVARQGEYALALVDLDRFKLINDRLGHGAGDVVLANVARSLVTTVGDAGTVARWGGEEFLVVLPSVSLAEARDVLEAVRADMEAEYGARDSIARVTVSVGLAHAERYAGKEEVLRLADRNLYRAKSSGRNIVVASSLADAHDAV